MSVSAYSHIIATKRLRGFPALRQRSYAVTLAYPLVIGRNSQALASLHAYGKGETEKVKDISMDLGRAQILSIVVTFPYSQQLGRIVMI